MKKHIAAAALVLTSAAALATIPHASQATNIGHEGCTPGYWKNHAESWEEYTTSTKISDIGNVGHPAWTFPTALASFADMTLLQALQARGGTGTSGAAEILVRAGAAAWLNAAHEGVGYPFRRFAPGLDGSGPMDALVNHALMSGDRAEMITVAATLDRANNLGCPLS
jgi:hypothetical protein